MSASAKIIAHSISECGVELITVQLRYWRAIHSELMTHRVFSRNASSSRAIPVSVMLRQVWSNPAGPIHWGAEQSGMQADEEVASFPIKVAKFLWGFAAKVACIFAWSLMKVGIHKQVANRLLEPFQYIHVIVTATEWQNFFELRAHPDADPNIQQLADLILAAMQESTPTKLLDDQWHLPYITDKERIHNTLSTLKKMSTARCARVSYLTHDGKNPSKKKDISLHDRLVGSKPLHASPTEHQAQAMPFSNFYRNFRGWNQYRDEVEQKMYN